MDVAEWVRRNSLLTISALLAIASLFIVPIDTVLSYEYDRILRTICNLLVFLVIIAGLRECEVLDRVAQWTVGKISTTTALVGVLVLLPFFIAMLFTNDVALITVIPLGIVVLDRAGMRRLIPLVIVLQTAAANVGGSLTPFGNPHNLYIYNLADVYGFTLGQYLAPLIPVVVAGGMAILAMVLLVKRKPVEPVVTADVRVSDPWKVAVIAALFLLAVATVISGIPVYLTLAIVVVTFVLMMPRVFVKVDYSILFIFFFLFVFANTMAHLDAIRDFLVGCLSWDPLLTTVMVCQFTSNLPATVLLQPFTDRWDAVLVGADIGCFGTPIASMANILALKFYLRERDADAKRFFGIFAAVNIVMIVVMTAAWYLFY